MRTTMRLRGLVRFGAMNYVFFLVPPDREIASFDEVCFASRISQVQRTAERLVFVSSLPVLRAYALQAGVCID